MPALPQVQALQADTLVDSIGVGLHMTYTDTNYFSQWPTVLADLQRLGVRHVRDGFYNFPAGTPYVAEHQQLKSAGIKTIYVMPINNSTTPALVASIAKQVGDMESVEGPNECDLPGDCGTTQALGMANMLAFMPTVDAAGAAAGVPVIAASFSQYPAFSQVGNMSSEMAYNNLHVYYNGRYPGNSGWFCSDAQGNGCWGLPFWLDMAHEDAPAMPVDMTETGYMMVDNPQQDQIPMSTGASYIPRTVLLAYMRGIHRTWLYEFLDEV
ncbi:MAG: RICIN domain-containing protein, partial [Terracidiphilus sp.]